MIEVTAAIIHNDSKLLICQRPDGKQCENLWEFPGGKIEAGETAEECLIRECREELGITIKPEKFLCSVCYKYPDSTVNIHFYIATVIEGTPSTIEHKAIQWCTLTDLMELPLCPADNELIHQAAADIQNEMMLGSKGNMPL